jgi:hypothetical protein
MWFYVERIRKYKRKWDTDTENFFRAGKINGHFKVEIPMTMNV